MTNPYKPFSSEWAAHEKHAAFRGQATGTAMNQAELARLRPAPAATSAMGFGPAPVGASSASPANAGFPPAGPAAPGLGAIRLGLVAFGAVPAAAALYSRTGSGLGAFLAFAVLAVLAVQLLDWTPVARAVRLLLWVALGLGALHIAIRLGLEIGVLTALDQVVSARARALLDGYLSSDMVLRTRLLFGL